MKSEAVNLSRAPSLGIKQLFRCPYLVHDLAASTV